VQSKIAIVTKFTTSASVRGIGAIVIGNCFKFEVNRGTPTAAKNNVK
jgi:hypothetical protein